MSTSNTLKYTTVSEPKAKTPHRQLSKVVHVKAIQQVGTGGGGVGWLGKMVDTVRGVCWRQDKKMQSSSILENTQETIYKAKTVNKEV